ncbi:hypothetical protein AXF42_Ash005516 [Apostasia shenzhenica]|uniref:Uncharacterized protein n=1 Tax=Apostasia shenzhenica TaxID=1088818 RepID=A0A2I0B781_9ASPA|nr:hypothetical protein AXF42_Ash005516 [Apostasia shenzhenica]
MQQLRAITQLKVGSFLTVSDLKIPLFFLLFQNEEKFFPEERKGPVRYNREEEKINVGSNILQSSCNSFRRSVKLPRKNFPSATEMICEGGGGESFSEGTEKASRWRRQNPQRHRRRSAVERKALRRRGKVRRRRWRGKLQRRHREVETWLICEGTGDALCVERKVSEKLRGRKHALGFLQRGERGKF